MQPLSTLGGDGSQAWGINRQGLIAGNAATAQGNQNAFLYSAGVMKGLGTLGGLNSFARGINNSNVVVGYAENSRGDHRAFLWITNTLYDLNALIPSTSNWILTEAKAINDAGQIAGIGRMGLADQVNHAFLLSPVPAPGTSNQPPVVSLNYPTNGSVLFEGDTVALSARASDQDGMVTQVLFYAGTQSVGFATSPPDQVVRTNVPAGVYQLRALAIDDGGMMQTSGPVNVTVVAFNTNAPRVAILGAASPEYNADIRQKLRVTALFGGVDVIPVTASDPTPTLAQLSQYGSVLVHSFAPFGSSAALGNVLADYVQAGHGVVLALHSQDTAIGPLSGRVLTNGFLPWTVTADDSSTFLTLQKLAPQHPILAGVTSFNGGSYSVFQKDVVLSHGSVLVAQWSNGQPLVAAREVGGGLVVGLNLFPVSSDARSDSWQANSDGGRLMGNALVWAAGPPAAARVTLTTVSNIASFLPGQDIVLNASLSNLTAQAVQVSFYANSLLLGRVTNSPYSFTWPHPPVGHYVATAVLTDAQSNRIASSDLALSVDSRLSISLVSPTNGTIFYLPTNITFQVALTDLDAAVVQVDYWRDGTERLGTVTNAPFSFIFTQAGAGVQNISAQVTDALGATRTTPPITVTVIDPASPVQTAWTAATNAWSVPTNWSHGIPRTQDTAYIDNGGTASLLTGAGNALNLVIGSASRGHVIQTAANLTVGQSVTLGELSGSAGTFELQGPGQLSAQSLYVGLGGDGLFVQSGGTNALNVLGLSGDSGAHGTYQLVTGQLISLLEYVGSYGTNGALFSQSGGTNTATQSSAVGQGQGRAGSYALQGGWLNVPFEVIGSDYSLESTVRQSAGSLCASSPRDACNGSGTPPGASLWS